MSGPLRGDFFYSHCRPSLILQLQFFWRFSQLCVMFVISILVLLAEYFMLCETFHSVICLLNINSLLYSTGLYVV